MSTTHIVAAEVNNDDAAKPRITHVIFDLDGTLLDTESLVEEVSRILVEGHGKVWNHEGSENRLGKRPMEATQSLIDQFELPCTKEELRDQCVGMLQERWHRAKALPGAIRLIKHFENHGVQMALASSSPRKNITAKLSFHSELKNAFSISVSGDEVTTGKPNPEIFLKTANLLGCEPSSVLVFEDAPAGVASAKAANMKVVAIPSLPKKKFRPLYQKADQVLASLLDVRPEDWGLPPFTDWIHEALPIDPWHLKGPVIKGFGRGSKVLGIPTANLPTESFSGELSSHTCGIYMGFAGLKGRVFKMVMSVGWNPFFDNEEKTVEPWLLHEFEEDFYGDELRLLVVGYIRPEADFTSLEDLVERIHKDGEISRHALDLEPFSKFRSDSFLVSG